jgi:hypothetical protein
MSQYKKIPDWQWLSDILEDYKIVDTFGIADKRDFTGIEARLYSQIRRRYVARKPVKHIELNNSVTSEEREESKRIHSEQVETMKQMGYELMLDGDTFYKIGYEIDPYMNTTFSMNQAYAIHNFVKSMSESNLIEERDKNNE